jgi:hypothetical protein
LVGGVSATTTVEDFERSNPFDDYTQHLGNSDQFTTVNSPVLEGSVAGKMSSDSTKGVIISQSGLNYYPKEGDTINIRFRYPSSDNSMKNYIIFGAEDSSNYYFAGINKDQPSGDSDKISMGKVVSGSVEGLGGANNPTDYWKNISVNNDEWLEYEIDYRVNSDKLNLTVYDSQGNMIEKLSRTDTGINGSGFGLRANQGLDTTSEYTYLDNITAEKSGSSDGGSGGSTDCSYTDSLAGEQFHAFMNESTSPICDTSGNDYDLNVSGSPIFGVGSGNSFNDGEAIGFSGDDYLYTADQTNLNPSGNFTITSWANNSDLSVSSAVMQKGRSGGDEQYAMDYDSKSGSCSSHSSVRVIMRDSNKNGYTPSTPCGVVQEGKWHFIAMSYNKPNGSFHIDVYDSNGLVNSSEVSVGTFNILDTSYQFTIGSKTDSDGTIKQKFNGEIDEPRVFNEFKTESEIQNLYSNNNLSESFENSAPSISNIDPSDGATGINDTDDSNGIDVDISFDISDPDGNQTDVSVKWKNGTEFYSESNIASGSTVSTQLENLAEGTTYEWQVEATDGDLTTNAGNYSFTTADTTSQSSDVIDDFERSSPLDEYNVYQGSKTQFNVVNSPVFSGSQAIEVGSDSTKNVFISQSGLNKYPAEGSDISGRVYYPSGETVKAFIVFGAEDGDNYYWAGINADKSSSSDYQIQLSKQEGGTNTGLGTVAVGSFPRDEWLQYEINYRSSGDTLELKLYDSSGSLIDTVSATDTSINGTGIGFRVNQGIDSTREIAYMDLFNTTSGTTVPDNYAPEVTVESPSDGASNLTITNTPRDQWRPANAGVNGYGKMTDMTVCGKTYDNIADPGVVKLDNGTYWAYHSGQKDGNYEMLRFSSSDGKSWSADCGVSPYDTLDYAPSDATQTEDGVIHLTATESGTQVYQNTTDGVSFSSKVKPIIPTSGIEDKNAETGFLVDGNEYIMMYEWRDQDLDGLGLFSGFTNQTGGFTNPNKYYGAGKKIIPHGADGSWWSYDTGDPDPWMYNGCKFIWHDARPSTSTKEDYSIGLMTDVHTGCDSDWDNLSQLTDNPALGKDQNDGYWYEKGVGDMEVYNISEDQWGGVVESGWGATNPPGVFIGDLDWVGINVSVSDQDDSGLLNATLVNASNDQEIMMEKIPNGKHEVLTWGGLEPNSSYSFYVNVTDGQNTTQSQTYTFNTEQDTEDTTPPSSSDNWTASGFVDKTSAEIELTASDSEGSVSNITYSINGGSEQTIQGSSGTITVSQNGNNTVEYFATDDAGNVENSTTINVALADIQETVFGLKQNTSKKSDTDTQYLFKNKELSNPVSQAVNGLSFSTASVPGNCQNCGSKQVDFQADESKNITSRTQGDWIAGEQAYGLDKASSSVEYGAFDTNYSTSQMIEARNDNVNLDLSVKLDPAIPSNTECSVSSGTEVSIASGATENHSITKSCDPGDEEDYSLTKSISDNVSSYEYNGTVEVYSDRTDEVEHEYWAEKSRFTDFSNRNTSSVNYSIDGITEGLDVSVKSRDGSDYLVWTAYTNRTNSSVHQGTHYFNYEYSVSDSSSDDGGTGGTGGTGSTGSSGDQTQITESPYDWGVTLVDSDFVGIFKPSVRPGQSFEKEIVVNSDERDLEIDVFCESEGSACEWVSPDITTVNFEDEGQTIVTIKGKVPEDAQRDTFRFNIAFTDPAHEEGSSVGKNTVKFVVSTESRWDFLFEYWNSLTGTYNGVPIAFFGLFMAMLFFVPTWALGRLEKYPKIVPTVAVLIFLITVGVI